MVAEYDTGDNNETFTMDIMENLKTVGALFKPWLDI